jgi:hypothetical protein
MAALPMPLLTAFDQMGNSLPGLDAAPERIPGRIDDTAIAAITDLYREVMPPGGAILDLMSSWIGHLPPEIP